MSQDASRPYHVQIADHLRQMIANGAYQVGDKIPSLRSLADTFDVAEPTAHQAVRTLQAEGVLSSTSGRGTYVLARPQERADEIAQLRARVEDLERRLSALEQRGDPATLRPGPGSADQ